MNVLILGSGGREHALAHSVSNSNIVENIYVMPGNPGISKIATIIDEDPLDNDLVKHFAYLHSVDLIIPGSEVYLENGVADIFKDTKISVFGPTKSAARIESSKEFAKDLMKKYNIPTAKYEVFNTYEDAKQYVLKEQTPIVIKYDGLAGGKGVVVAMTEQEAIQALHLMLIERKYGEANVIIEEYLEGPEFSLMCFVHDELVIPMPIAQDHKRLLENDLGPNTGGMGIYSSVPIIPDEEVHKAINSIMIPTVKALKKEGSTYTGFLYGGLILTNDGPKVIEFNARFGDPETEVILPKLESDIVQIITSLLKNKRVMIRWNNEYYVGVVLASKGYPGSYQKGFVIEGLENIDDLVFHMGTKREKNDIVTNGGRVLLITGKGKTLPKAVENVYNNINKIKCDNLIYRKDIAYKSLKR